MKLSRKHGSYLRGRRISHPSDSFNKRKTSRRVRSSFDVPLSLRITVSDADWLTALATASGRSESEIVRHSIKALRLSLAAVEPFDVYQAVEATRKR